jgi:hypothetical protein
LAGSEIAKNYSAVLLQIRTACIAKMAHIVNVTPKESTGDALKVFYGTNCVEKFDCATMSTIQNYITLTGSSERELNFVYKQISNSTVFPLSCVNESLYNYANVYLKHYNSVKEKLNELLSQLT